ncbi:RHS repeat domain-containing protein [Porphyromonas gulae]|uniref:RHS repeat domain-containing protein n=1 Tax=Porphyromonas gulae TaxID=111105 RepID=UPI0003622AAA|nr:RHS repeat-associated core domain-containing protein [Porphyromonas gulae]
MESIYKAPDAIGNLFRTPERKDRKYGKGGRLLEDRKYSYHYDGEGNLVLKQRLRPDETLAPLWQEGDWAYEWLGNGMLRSVKRPDGETVSFEYDPLGRRISKTYKEKTTRWVWDGNVPLHEWTEEEKKVTEQTEDGRGESLITWLFEEGSFVPCAKLQNGESYSIVTDYLGTPTHAFDSKGNKVWERNLDIYGKIRTGNSTFVPFLYQGQYWDEETDLCYNRFRYYNPSSGTYISQDPIRLAGGIALYGYVHDSNSWIDPLGLSELVDLVNEAHSLLDPRAQRSKTTAIGVGQDGKMYIASSDDLVPKVQRDWAISKDIEPIRGIGHAEETLMNANKGITQIDASRKICLDCENMMNQNNVTTATEKSGKRSKNRVNSCG